MAPKEALSGPSAFGRLEIPFTPTTEHLAEAHNWLVVASLFLAPKWFAIRLFTTAVASQLHWSLTCEFAAALILFTAVAVAFKRLWRWKRVIDAECQVLWLQRSVLFFAQAEQVADLRPCRCVVVRAYQSQGFLGRLQYWWVVELVLTGSRRLEISDRISIPQSDFHNSNPPCDLVDIAEAVRALLNIKILVEELEP